MRQCDCQRRLRCMRLAACAVLAAAAVPARAAVFYDLGILGGRHSAAYGLNSAGQVVGGSDPRDGNEWEAFLYSGRPGNGGSMASLGVLSGRISYANGINDSGQIVGTSAAEGNTAQHAFVYVGTPGQGGHMIDLTPEGNQVWSQGEAINASGQVAGTYMGQTGNQAFRYTGLPGTGGSLVKLGTLGGDASYGFGINDAGQVVGYSELAHNDSNHHAFIYTGTPGAGGAMRDLGALTASRRSAANAINNAGQVTGWADLPNQEQDAFLYSGTPGVDGRMIDLGRLGGRYSRGFDINSAGDVVGDSEFGGIVTHAFVYHGVPGAGGRMIDLDAWAHAVDPTSTAGYTLVAAFEITDGGLIAGLAVTGIAENERSRAFLLDASSLLPEPGAMALLAPAAAGLLCRRRRPRRSPCAVV